MFKLTLSFCCLVLLSLYAYSQEIQELVIVEKVEVLTSLAREPMLAEHPSGDLYVTGFRNASDRSQLWKSVDRGQSWTEVDIGRNSQGADGNSDVDLMIDDRGVIYFLCMRFTRIPEDTTGFNWASLKGERITIGISYDNGSSWNWTSISEKEFDDRPWVEVASDGSVHVIWNNGKGVHHTMSEDQGKSWQIQPDIYPKGGSSHFSAGPSGQLAVRVTPVSASGYVFHEGVDLIRLSLDCGRTWTDVKIPGNRDWINGIPRWVEPIAWDKNNRMYYLWSEGNQLKIGVSENNGEDWITHLIEDSNDTIYFPYLSLKGNDICCTWVSGFGEDLRHHAAVLSFGNGELLISRLVPQKIYDIRTRFGLDDELSTGGEYFPIKSLSDGDFGMVTTIQNYAENRFGFTWWRLSNEKLNE